MTNPDEPIILKDAPDGRFEAIHSAAEGLLLDSENKFSFEHEHPSLPPGMPNVRINHVLNGINGSDEGRYIGVELDRAGVQVAMFPFFESDSTPLTDDETAVGIIHPPNDIGSFVCVDFFSISQDGLLQLGGVQSDASEDELNELTKAIMDSRLTEVTNDMQTVQYSAIIISAMRRLPEIREAKYKEFLQRKEDQLREESAKIFGDDVTLEEAVAKIEADVEAKKQELRELEWKIAHPVRGVLKEAGESVSGAVKELFRAN